VKSDNGPVTSFRAGVPGPMTLADAVALNGSQAGAKHALDNHVHRTQFRDCSIDGAFVTCLADASAMFRYDKRCLCSLELFHNGVFKGKHLFTEGTIKLGVLWGNLISI
jgi:hypothetical protein